MRAVVLTAFGDTDKLELRDVPEPSAGPNEVKVRVVAASINPIDWKLRSGAHQAFMPLALPAILGKDAAGEVIGVGTGVTAFKVGARVLGRANAAYAELVVAPVEAWAEVPPTMSLADAGALPLVLLTGAQLVEEAVNVRVGERGAGGKVILLM